MRILYLNLPDWIKGTALTPNLILIDKSRRDDAVLLAHETLHCEQMALYGTVTFWWKYLTSRAFRQQMEVAAYRVSYQHAPERVAQFATALSTQYRLGLTFEQAMGLIETGTRYEREAI